MYTYLIGSQKPEGLFNIKKPSNQYRKSHCGDKKILRPSYLHNGISYTAKMTSSYWIRAQVEYVIHANLWSAWKIMSVPER